MKPIYGQVISSAPSWAGPMDFPPLPTEAAQPPEKDHFWGDLVGDVGGTLAGGICGAVLGEIPLLGEAVCPVAGGLAKQGIQKLFD